MFRLARPSPVEIAAFRERQSGLDFSYAEVKCTRGAPPARFTVDHNRALLGHGNEAFEAARGAVASWRMFDLGWVHLCDPTAPIEVGTTVAVLVRSLGLWSLNAARIVYVVDERDRFGFAYGTLPEHVESGEERFLVERDAHGTVSYDILACSRPHHPLARLAYPIVRGLQHRFARDSLIAMQRAVATNDQSDFLFR